MKRPRTQTMVIGHPLVAGLFGLCAIAAALVAWQQGSFMLGLAAFAVLAMVGGANQQAGAYKRWKREWDGMADPATSGSKKPSHAATLGALALLYGGIYVLWAEHIAGATIIGWAVGIGAVITALLLARGLVRRWRTRRSNVAEPAAIVATPILPVPTLRAAYAALPEHCRQVLERRP